MKIPAVTVRGTQRTVLARGTRVRKSILVDGSRVKTGRKDIGGRTVLTLRVPISSTGVDRDGDAFTENGLEDMVEQLKTGRVPVYLDHGVRPGDFGPTYGVLDMLGKWTDGEVEDGILFATAELDEGDFRAQELMRKTEAGLPIGYSVGFIVHESQPRKDEEGSTTGQKFDKTDLIEVSAVGIPSNPDAVTSTIPLMAKHLGMTPGALRRKLGLPQEEDNMDLTEAEVKQIEAQRKAGKDGEAVPDEPEPETVDVRALIKEELRADRKALVKDLVAALKESKPDEEEEEEEDEDEKGDDEDEEKEEDEDDEEKSAPKPTKKRPQPRGIATAPEAKPKTTTPGEGKAAEAAIPFQFAQ